MATGAGGSITIEAAESLSFNHAKVETDTARAEGGNVRISSGGLFDLRNSKLKTSVVSETGNGGNIGIGSFLMVLDNNDITANAVRGHGGDINIQAGRLIRTPDNRIDASSKENVSGTIAITAPNTDVTGNLVVLPETLLDASSQLREACAARCGRPLSSLTLGGRGSLPPDPGTPLASTPTLDTGESGRSELNQAVPPPATACRPIR